jgi:hypothetical protein
LAAVRIHFVDLYDRCASLRYAATCQTVKTFAILCMSSSMLRNARKQNVLRTSVSGKSRRLTTSVSGKSRRLTTSVSGNSRRLTTSVSGKSRRLPKKPNGLSDMSCSTKEIRETRRNERKATQSSLPRCKGTRSSTWSLEELILPS